MEYKKKKKIATDQELYESLSRDIFSEKIPVANYIIVNDRFIIKVDKYIRMINEKYLLEKEGLATNEINDGELEIQEDDVSEDDSESEPSEHDLEDSDEDIDPEKRKLKLRDKYMIQEYNKEAQKVQLNQADY